ncbi:hypothetical protein ABZP36_030916 [Zizania latifolia]
MLRSRSQPNAGAGAPLRAPLPAPSSAPREHESVVPWNRRSSLPLARQRGFFFGSFVALPFAFTRSTPQSFWLPAQRVADRHRLPS